MKIYKVVVAFLSETPKLVSAEVAAVRADGYRVERCEASNYKAIVKNDEVYLSPLEAIDAYVRREEGAIQCAKNMTSLAELRIRNAGYLRDYVKDKPFPE